MNQSTVLCDHDGCNAPAVWFVEQNMNPVPFCEAHSRGHLCDDGILHPIAEWDRNDSPLVNLLRSLDERNGYKPAPSSPSAQGG
jgi:hypothetical protein